LGAALADVWIGEVTAEEAIAGALDALRAAFEGA